MTAEKLTLGTASGTIVDVYNSADVAELADARGSGPRSRKGVEVQVLSSAPADSLASSGKHRQ